MNLRATPSATMTLALAAVVVIASASTLAARLIASPSAHFADAEDARLAAHGAQLYAQRCASCHGRRLQGQPLWQLVDQYSGRRAPAHDQTGHSWMHSDEDLFQITKTGWFPSASRDRPSHMPAYEGQLDDADIVAVIAFIKGRWPIGLRALQAMRNPGGEGMPREAATTDWTLPAACLSGHPPAAAAPGRGG